MALPFGLSPGVAIFLLAAILGAAVVRGFSGFGFSALVVAVTGLVSDPRNAVAVVLFCEVVMTLQAARGIAGHVDWSRVGLLLLGAAVGVPLGIHGLVTIGVDGARVAISLFILVMCAVLLAGWQTGREIRGWPNAALGVVSGVANGAAMAGLPVAVQRHARTVMHADLGSLDVRGAVVTELVLLAPGGREPATLTVDQIAVYGVLGHAATATAQDESIAPAAYSVRAASRFSPAAGTSSLS